MDVHLLGLQTEHGGHIDLVHGLELRAGPDFAGTAYQADDAVHRLHRGVGQEREFEIRLQALRRRAEGRLGIAILAGNGAGLFQQRLVLLQ